VQNRIAIHRTRERSYPSRNRAYQSLQSPAFGYQKQVSCHSQTQLPSLSFFIFILHYHYPSCYHHYHCLPRGTIATGFPLPNGTTVCLSGLPGLPASTCRLFCGSKAQMHGTLRPRCFAGHVLIAHVHASPLRPCLLAPCSLATLSIFPAVWILNIVAPRAVTLLPAHLLGAVEAVGQRRWSRAQLWER
jgi:hypothetical protein